MPSLKGSSEHFRTFSVMFGSLRKIVGKGSEIPDMTRRKPDVFDSEIVGSYTIVFPLVQVKPDGIV